MVDRESVLTRRFVREFYDRVSVFVDTKDAWNTEEYLFHKLYGTDILDDTRWLHVPVKKQSAEVMAESPAAAQASNEWNVRQDKLEEQLQQEMARKQFQAVKKRIQEREEAERKEQEERLQCLLDELNALVGLQGVKDEIRSLVNLIRIRKLRETMGRQHIDWWQKSIGSLGSYPREPLLKRTAPGLWQDMSARRHLRCTNWSSRQLGGFFLLMKHMPWSILMFRMILVWKQWIH